MQRVVLIILLFTFSAPALAVPPKRSGHSKSCEPYLINPMVEDKVNELALQIAEWRADLNEVASPSGQINPGVLPVYELLETLETLVAEIRANYRVSAEIVEQKLTQLEELVKISRPDVVNTITVAKLMAGAVNSAEPQERPSGGTMKRETLRFSDDLPGWPLDLGPNWPPKEKP